MREVRISSIKSLLQAKLSRDIIYSLVSFGVLATTGVLINLAITAYSGVESLGVFNIAYAFYILSSQIAVWGIHNSVLRYTAFFKDRPKILSIQLISGSCIVLITGSICSLVIYITSPFTKGIFNSAETSLAIKYASYGLILFPINKVLLNFLNGLRMMRAYATFQSLRYVTILAVIIYLLKTKHSAAHLTYSFIVAELTTFAFVLIFLIRFSLLPIKKISTFWFKKHLKFGNQGLFSSLFVEFNSRIDVLMIGVFMSDKMTGIYSFAAMFIDGLYHVLSMLRINLNPIIVTSFKTGKFTELKGIIASLKKYVPLVMIILTMIIFSLYLFIGSYLLKEEDIKIGIIILFVLMFGLILVSPFIPFEQTLMMAGYPNLQKGQQLFMVVVNIVLAVCLIPTIGIYGAAVGTACSYLANIIFMSYFSKCKLGFSFFAKHEKTKNIDY